MESLIDDLHALMHVSKVRVPVLGCFERCWHILVITNNLSVLSIIQFTRSLTATNRLGCRFATCSVQLEFDGNCLLYLWATLRHDIRCPQWLLPDSLRDALIAAREAYPKPTGDMEPRWNAFRAVWKAFAAHTATRPNSVWHLPPLYLDYEPLEMTTRDIVEGYLRRENWPDVIQGAGHSVLSGMVGVGKTTIIKAFALALAVLSPSHIPIYIDYKKLREQRHNCYQLTAAHFFREALVRLTSHDFSGKLGCLTGEVVESLPTDSSGRFVDALASAPWAVAPGVLSGEPMNARPVLILDEVQLVLEHIAASKTAAREMSNPTPETATQAMSIAIPKTATQVMNSFENYARDCAGALLVMTGSVSDLRNRLVANPHRPVEYSGLPDFNKDLCLFNIVDALRNRDCLRRFVEQRYGVKITSEATSKLLHYTGGNCRLVDVALRGVTKMQVTRAVRSLDTQADGTGSQVELTAEQFDLRVSAERRAKIEQAWDAHNGVLAAVVALILVKPSCQQASTAIRSGDSVAMPLAEQTGVVSTPDINDPSDLEVCVNSLRAQLWAGAQPLRTEANCHFLERALRELVNNDILYFVNRATIQYVQFALPSDLQFYKTLLGESDLDAVRQIWLVNLMLHSVKHEFVNAGKPLEKLMFRRIQHFHSEPSCRVPSSAIRELAITDSGLLSVSHRSTYRHLSTLEDLEPVSGTWLAWRSECGLDAVMIALKGDKATLHGWQCKGSALAADPLSHGSVATAMEAWTKKAKKLSEFSTSIASVQTKAAVGFVMLALALERSVTGLTIQLGTLLLTSTVQGVRGQGDNTTMRQTVDCSSILAAQRRPVSVRAAASSAISGSTYDFIGLFGMDWVLMGLGTEPSLLRLMTSLFGHAR